MLILMPIDDEHFDDNKGEKLCLNDEDAMGTTMLLWMMNLMIRLIVRVLDGSLWVSTIFDD